LYFTMELAFSRRCRKWRLQQLVIDAIEAKLYVKRCLNIARYHT
jgi:hypothetical protein